MRSTLLALTIVMLAVSPTTFAQGSIGSGPIVNGQWHWLKGGTLVPGCVPLPLTKAGQKELMDHLRNASYPKAGFAGKGCNKGPINYTKTSNTVQSGTATGLNHLGLSQTEALGILGGVAAAGVIAGVAVAASSGGGGGGASGTTGG